MSSAIRITKFYYPFAVSLREYGGAIRTRCVGRLRDRRCCSAVHKFVQRKVTHTLSLPEADFRTRFDEAVRHVEHYREFGQACPLHASAFLEFGAGWDVAIALTYIAAGVPRGSISTRETRWCRRTWLAYASIASAMQLRVQEES